jgi:esterase/lipase superfamily enzyme
LPSPHVVILRIEDVSSESETALTLSGRITSRDVPQLKARIDETRAPVALELQQVRLVDLDAVRFLAAAERKGVELRDVPPFVRAWILLERPNLGDLE